MTGADGIVMTGATHRDDGRGRFDTEGRSVTITQANGIVMTGADRNCHDRADGIVMTGADGIVMTGGRWHRNTGADGIVMTGAIPCEPRTPMERSTR